MERMNDASTCAKDKEDNTHATVADASTSQIQFKCASVCAMDKGVIAHMHLSHLHSE